MNSNKSELVNNYHQYLPVILQKNVFIGKFLRGFEKILSGLSESPSKEQIITANTQNIPGLEEILDNIHLYFSPRDTPEEFLPWLAGWVALSLRDDWAVKVKREFIQQIVPLYQLRGTKRGLIEILQIYLESSGFGNEKVEVFDEFDNFPNYFQVQLTLNDRDPDKYWRQAKIAKAIIDQEKPAHTFYSLKILVPTMQITKRSQVAYPFKLFAPPLNQKFAIEVIITPSNNNIPLNQLAQQLLVQIQGNSKPITPELKVAINNQAYSVRQNLTYLDLQENLNGFNVTLSNRTDKQFQGTLTIKLYFSINEQEFDNILLEQTLNLSPVLKICIQNDKTQIIAGNTILQIASQPQPSGMKLTESIWTKPYSFQIFEAPKIQELQPNIIALIEKLELAAIVEITKPDTISTDLINQITVRLKDSLQGNFSSYHLLTPETIIDNNKITIKRTLYYQQFLQIIDQLAVTIKNLNNVEVAGKVIVQVSLTINQRSFIYKLLEQTFTLKNVPPYDILQICRRDQDGKIVSGNTILGTTSQSLK